MAEPTFWDSIASVGVGAASTAKLAFQDTLGAFTGAVQFKIDETSGKIQSKINATAKNTSANPAPSAPQPTPPGKNPPGFSVLGILLVVVLVVLLVRGRMK